VTAFRAPAGKPETDTEIAAQFDGPQHAPSPQWLTRVRMEAWQIGGMGGPELS